MENGLDDTWIQDQITLNFGMVDGLERGMGGGMDHDDGGKDEGNQGGDNPKPGGSLRNGCVPFAERNKNFVVGGYENRFGQSLTDSDSKSFISEYH